MRSLILLTLLAAEAAAFAKFFRPNGPLSCAACSDIPLLKDRDDFLVKGIGNITSYAGFFQTAKTETYENHMFWWYFPPQTGNTSAPVVIWLQGGPGGSSLFGLFSEMGPFSLTADLEVVDRPSSWNKRYGMLFIDNPVGAGFSYTTDDSGYCNNTARDVSSNLYALIQNFYGVFPELLNNDLYITGESYAGHYVPAFAYYIDLNQHTAPFKIPLKGIAVGDGWIDPIEQVRGYPELMYNVGMIDTHQRSVIQEICDETVKFISEGEYELAFDVWDKMLNGDVFPYGNLFHNMTGSNDYDNFLNTNAPESFGYYSKYVNQPNIREALHVGNAIFHDGSACEHHLIPDFMKSFKCELAGLMESYKVLIYSGQLDIIIGAALTERFLQTVQWSGQDRFQNSSRMVWRLSPSDPEVAGYVKVVDNFQQVVVRGGGHILPYDQPDRSLDMITRFIENIPYQSYPNPVPPRRENAPEALIPQ